jgi:transcriptional regulator with XRE-family HTH domain
MKIDQMQVSERLNKIMQKLSLNQMQLADLLGITQPAVSKYLKNRIPPAHILYKIAQLSGQSMEWFLTGDLESMIYKVSEPGSTYNGRLKLEKKISLLPKEIYNHLEYLVDSILDNLNNSSHHSA